MQSSNRFEFWSDNLGPYERNLQELVIQVGEEPDLVDLIAYVERHLLNFDQYPNAAEAALRYRAFLSVLLDLLRQEWRPVVHQGKLYLELPEWSYEPHGSEEIKLHKQAVRRALSWEREAQFAKESVQKFVARMERTRHFKGNKVSILSLAADGPQLAKELRTLMSNGDLSISHIHRVIKPYVQLIEPDSYCEHTGFRLQDIWRYFRYTWSTPYNSTPGRQMSYLIRDAAHPFHPVIGIAGLGSSLVQLTVRDDIIGWTKKSIAQRLEREDLTEEQAKQIGRMLTNTLNAGLSDIDSSDLVLEKELAEPSDQVLECLKEIEEQSRAKRIEVLALLQELEATRVPSAQRPLIPHDDYLDVEELRKEAEYLLFRSKRAKALRRLLFSRKTIQETNKSIETVDGIKSLWARKRGQQAIHWLVRENKKRKIGINMMDIIICGSIPPYNILLGGKLVAMLLTSPEIVLNYQQKYDSYTSTIASKMKGESVFRDAQLVFLGTTSLYSGGSSQYNRIAIPTKRDGEKVRYLRYGLTEGYGSVHFSEETVNLLNKLQELTYSARLINNNFGEGVNPKLRRIRVGLTAIGLKADYFLQHHSKRIVYGVPLGRQTYEFLRGESEAPDYFFKASSMEEAITITREISDFWTRRWLLKRIQKGKYLEDVAKFDKASILLSNTVEEISADQQAIQQTLDV